MTTKTRNRRPRRKPTPTVDLRKPLPTRPQAPTHSGIPAGELAAARAALTTALTGIHPYTPVTAWHPTANGEAHQQNPAGGHLHYNPHDPTPLTAITPCARGAHHTTPITNPHDLHTASIEAQHCRTDHTPGFHWPDMVRLTPVLALGTTDDEDDEPDDELHLTRPAAEESDLETTQPIHTITDQEPTP